MNANTMDDVRKLAAVFFSFVIASKHTRIKDNNRGQKKTLRILCEIDIEDEE